MSKISVANMVSRHSGREVANQFIVQTDEGRYFQSYRTIIAKIQNGQVTLDPAWDCSKTTAKYRREFLGEGVEETRRKIANGTYRVEPLNA